jgi:hypothetical protein
MKYATQGGGKVERVGDSYFFVERPDCPGFNIGDKMPKEWGIVPLPIDYICPLCGTVLFKYEICRCDNCAHPDPDEID